MLLDEKIKPEVPLPEAEETRRKRIEEARKKILTDRKQFESQAVNVTDEILNGTDYTEEVLVKMTGKRWGKVTIRPLSEGELISLFSKLGNDRLNNVGKNPIEDYDFYWQVVEKSTGLNLDKLKKAFVMGESVLLGDRILEISGLREDNPEKVESFPEK